MLTTSIPASKRRPHSPQLPRLVPVERPGAGLTICRQRPSDGETPGSEAAQTPVRGHLILWRHGPSSGQFDPAGVAIDVGGLGFFRLPISDGALASADASALILWRDRSTRLSCKLKYLLTSNHGDGSIASEIHGRLSTASPPPRFLAPACGEIKPSSRVTSIVRVNQQSCARGGLLRFFRSFSNRVVSIV